jgi:hypothetical protein
MTIETVDELCEHLADLIGVYGCCTKAETNKDCDNENECCCRVGFMMTMPDRIREAVENDKKLEIFKHKAQ